VSSRLDPFDKGAAAFSLILHTTVFAVAWFSTLNTDPEIEFVSYEIELVSPPPAEQAEVPQPPVEELVVERPEPEPEPPTTEPEVAPAEPEPEPEPTPPPPEPDVEPEPATTVESPPEVEPETSGEGLAVRIEGLRRDYPAYYEGIIRQVDRCFRTRWRQGGNWETVVLFTIGRDGLATDVEFGSRSGNVSFDFTAFEAVSDCAGQGRFGPLPEDFPWEAVRVSFTFAPPSD
jgi:hypothetical protein